MKNILTIAILSLSSLIAFSQSSVTWQILNTGTTKKINDVYFQSPDTGYIVGEDYLFKKTTDGGLNWTSLTPPSIGQRPNNKGNIIGIDYYKSSSISNLDSGLYLRWEQPYHGVFTKNDGKSYSIVNIFNDSNIFCFVSGFNILPEMYGNSSGIYTHLITYGKNCNGNAIFSDYYDGPFSVGNIDTSSQGSFTTVDVNRNVSIIGHSDGHLLRYKNVLGKPDTFFLDSSGVLAIAYAGNHKWYASTNKGYYGVYVSVDSGKTFRKDSTFYPTFDYPIINDFSFLPNDIGIGGASTFGGGMIILRDSNRWDLYPANQTINAVKIFPNGTAYAAGDSGLVMKTVINTSINEIEKNNTLIKIYPNPVNDILYINGLQGLSVQSIQLFDIHGKILREFPTTNRELNVLDFPRGIYIVKIQTDKYQVSKKVIVK